jgi:L-rhamnose-H+ transport protein
MPPLFAGTFGTLLKSASGLTVLAGVAACLVGIGMSGAAGMSKEAELSPEQKAAAVKEFDFKKGMMVAAFSGVMSSCFAYGLAAGKPIGEITLVALQSEGGSPLWQNLPILVVVLWGGFTTNFLWCVVLNIRNRSTHQYLNTSSDHHAEMGEEEGVEAALALVEGRDHLAKKGAVDGVRMADAPEIATHREAAAHGASTGAARLEGPAPLARNYLLCAAAGFIWYLQFFFYSMGETKMGAFTFSSWTLHMASIIIFSTVWGIFLKEWQGVSGRTKALVGWGLFVLILSTVIVGYGNQLSALTTGH